MKKMMTLMLALMMVLAMASCGAEEAAPAATTAASVATEATETTAATEAAFEIPVVEVPETLMENGVVGSYFGQIMDYAYINTVMELVDDNTIKFDLYQPYLFCAADIQALEVGNTLVRGDRQVLVEEIRVEIYEGMDEEGANITINPNGDCIQLMRQSEFGAENLVWGDYQPIDVANNYTLMFEHTFTLEAAAEKLAYMRMSAAGAEQLTGADLVQALKDNAAFDVNNTAVTFEKGVLAYVTVLDY